MPRKGKGCRECHETGYKGRIGLFEVLEVSDGVRELILHGATPIEIRMLAKKEGMRTLRESGLLKIRDGLTSMEEVDRETFS